MCTSISRLENITEFPDRAEFNNDLDFDQPIENELYMTGKEVFEKFLCRNLMDFLMIYLITDIFVLAELMTEYFSSMRKLFDGLNPGL